MKMLLSVILLSAATACGVLETHSGYGVTVVNRMTTPVILFLRVPDLPADAGVAKGVRIDAGGRFSDQWLVPSGPRDSRGALVVAKDTGGVTVFCHLFTWRELQQVGFGIEVEAGRVDATRTDCS